MAGKNNRVTKDVKTPVGVLSFPRLFPDTVGKKDDGTPSYEVQILIPKTDKAGLRSLLAAIKEVGVAQWGEDNWKKVRQPLRDGDAEAGDLTDDGSTKGDKYPERLGHYFLNARSTKPVTVVDRSLNPIHESSEVYGGCKGVAHLTFYPYAVSGNSGIGVALNGVQKISDGEPFGGGRPSVESMFDMIEADDDDDLDDADEAPAKPAKKGKKGKKAKGDDDLFDDL